MTGELGVTSDDRLGGRFEDALAAHHAGDLVEAERRYRLVLARDPNHFDALHMLGIVYAQRGDFVQAEHLIERALAIDPDHVDALFNRGNMLRELKRYDAALASYEQALIRDGAHVMAHINRGVALFALRRYAEALASYDRALALRPDDAGTLTNRGNVLLALGRAAEALASHARAIALKPDFAEAHSNRGKALLEIGEPEPALSSYDRATALNPGDAKAHFHRGIALGALSRWEDAVAAYDRAVALKPNDVDVYANRGNALLHLGLPEAALESFERMVAFDPRAADAHYNRAVGLHALGRFDEALASVAAAIAIDPAHAKAHHTNALLLLVKGDFARGWEEFEWRWLHKDLVGGKRAFQRPLWRGDVALGGKTVLLHGEQGLGDALQFCRYVPMVAELGAHVVLEVAPALTALMQSLAGSPEVIGFGSALPDFELHCPLLSLPLAFKTDAASIPSTVPYLHPDPRSLDKWRARMAAIERPRIGLVWAGNPHHSNDHARSIGLEALLPLMRSARGRFVSLQRDLRDGDAEIMRAEPAIIHPGHELASFGDTAAVISMLDLVITVDTAVAHLAGALGKRLWLLLASNPDWRWQLNRSDSPWYPTARLFRQPRAQDWESVIGEVGRALQRDF
jgi:tetratricopeptide (TPR) repeat protein